MECGYRAYNAVISILEDEGTQVPAPHTFAFVAASVFGTVNYTYSLESRALDALQDKCLQQHERHLQQSMGSVSFNSYVTGTQIQISQGTRGT